MKDQTARGMRFINKWQKQRTKKWKYAFLHGSIFWGLPVSITLFLFDSHFEVDQMNLSKLFILIMVFLAGGFVSGLFEFKRIDKAYLRMLEEESIDDGIKILESGIKLDHEQLRKNQMESHFSE
jgi:uncharacterized membrane protein